MSTKLYNAFKTDQPLTELHTALSTFAAKVKTEAGTRFTDYVTREIVYFYDLWCCGIGPTKINPAAAVRTDLESRFVSLKDGENDPSVDYSFSVTIFPVSDAILMLLFTEHQDFVTLFEKEMDCADFSYWNNEDKPDDVDEDEWERRRLQWDMVFRTSMIPAHVGYTRDLVRVDDFSPMLSAAELENCLPKFDERCKRVALDMYVEEKQIKDFRNLHRLLSDYRTADELQQFELKANDILVQAIDTAILNQEHSR